MLKDAIERFRSYWYEYPGNPVELSETELNVKSLMPSKDDVVERGGRPHNDEGAQREGRGGIRDAEGTARKRRIG